MTLHKADTGRALRRRVKIEFDCRIQCPVPLSIKQSSAFLTIAECFHEAFTSDGSVLLGCFKDTGLSVLGDAVSNSPIIILVDSVVVVIELEPEVRKQIRACIGGDLIIVQRPVKEARHQALPVALALNPDTEHLSDDW